MRAHPNLKQTNGPVRVVIVAAAFGFAAAAITSGAALARQLPDDAEHALLAGVVIGTGPHAVYVGPAPTFGGDPGRGETDESYYARTGRHLPGLSSATAVDGPWWYGRAPVYGGDPASGETDASYYARTGRHLGR